MNRQNTSNHPCVWKKIILSPTTTTAADSSNHQKALCLNCTASCLGCDKIIANSQDD